MLRPPQLERPRFGMSFITKLSKRTSRSNNGLVNNILYQLTPDTLTPVEARIEVSWTWIDKNNYPNATRCTSNPDIGEKFKRMLNEGQIGIFALLENQEVAYCWAMIGRTSEPTVVNDVVSLSQGQAYIHFCHTNRHHRGMRVYPYLLSVLAQHLFQESEVKVVFIDTTTQNIASQRGILRTGFRPKRMLTRVTFMGKQLAIFPRNL